jgi:hypothetical protein
MTKAGTLRPYKDFGVLLNSLAFTPLLIFAEGLPCQERL